MPQFSAKRQVRHAAGDMFDLVADVEKYPQFVPLCAAMRLRSSQEKDNGTVVLVAEMTVSYKLVRQSFTSRVTLDKPNLRIRVEYLDGPFSHMQNRWSFRPSGADMCEVEFFIDYEFRSRTLAVLMGAMFETVFRRMANSFEQRADAVYGRARA